MPLQNGLPPHLKGALADVDTLLNSADSVDYRSHNLENKRPTPEVSWSSNVYSRIGSHKQLLERAIRGQ